MKTYSFFKLAAWLCAILILCTVPGVADAQPICTGVLDQQQTQNSGRGGDGQVHFQFFKSGRTGYLTQVDAYMQHPGNFTLKIYQGRGRDGNLLHEQSYQMAAGASADWYKLKLDNPIALTKAKTYTINIDRVQWYVGKNNPYADGGNDAEPNKHDFMFKTYVYSGDINNCQQFASGVNVALGKATRQSSRSGSNGKGSSERAVDGNTAGYWGAESCTMTKESENPWWEVDLGRVYDIQGINVWNRTEELVKGRLNNFYIMASEDPITANSTSQNLYVEGPQSPGVKTCLAFKKNTQARYIRIFIPGRDKRLSLAEVEVIEGIKPTPLALVEGTNIALFKVTRQSSRSGSNGKGSSERAVDGNTAGTWKDESCTMTKESENPWWEVDLGRVYDITGINVWNRAEESAKSRLNNFYIMASEDPITANSTNQNLYVEGPQLPGDEDYIAFYKQTRARYIRIFIPGRDKRLSLAEVQVMSDKESGATPANGVFKIVSRSGKYLHVDWNGDKKLSSRQQPNNNNDYWTNFILDGKDNYEIRTATYNKPIYWTMGEFSLEYRASSQRPVFSFVDKGNGKYQIKVSIAGQNQDSRWDNILFEDGSTGSIKATTSILIQEDSPLYLSTLFELEEAHIPTTNMRFLDKVQNGEVDSWTLRYETSIEEIDFPAVEGSQMPHAEIEVNTRVGTHLDQRFINFSVAESTVAATSSGELLHDRSDLRGYFLEAVEVHIECLNDDFVKKNYGPKNSGTDGSVSSSSGVDLSTGGSLGAGIDGKGPSAQMGLNYSMGLNFGMTYSTDLHAFTVDDISKGKAIRSLYKLSSTEAAGTWSNTKGGSVPYSEPMDLVRMDAAGQFGGTPLNNLPSLAINNFPIATLGTFKAPNDFNGTARFKVTVKMKLLKVKKDNKVFVVEADWDTKYCIAERIYAVDFNH
jgi:hypothetical protein